MKRLMILVALFLCAAHSFSQSEATTSSAVNLRSESRISDNVLGVIPKGETVEVTACDSGWCLVEYGGYTGYVSQKLLQTGSPQEITTSRPTATSPVHYYTNSRGNQVQSPTQYSSRPSGASAQCADGSYSFSQSRRGTCSHHGGVSVWY